MTELLGAIALFGGIFYLQNRSFNEERRDWTAERRLLLTRIQHPEIVVAPESAPAIPDEELLTSVPDDIDLVGTISTGSENGDGDSN